MEPLLFFIAMTKYRKQNNNCRMRPCISPSSVTRRPNKWRLAVNQLIILSRKRLSKPLAKQILPKEISVSRAYDLPKDGSPKMAVLHASGFAYADSSVVHSSVRGTRRCEAWLKQKNCILGVAFCYVAKCVYLTLRSALQWCAFRPECLHTLLRLKT